MTHVSEKYQLRISLLRGLLGITALLIFVAPSLRAQAPRTFSFQGVLSAADGTALSDGNHTLRLGLYAAASGGSAVYTETHTVAVSKGLFQAIIGSINPIPASMKFDTPWYLGVTVDNGTEMTPRTALTAVPYALHAASASTATTAAMASALAPGAQGVVTALNGVDGAITLQGAGGTTLTQNGSTITITSTTGGGGGGGIQSLQSPDGSISITGATGPTANLIIPDNSIGNAKLLDASIGLSKLNGSGASSGQVPMWNGSNVQWSTPGGGGLTLPYFGSHNSSAGVASFRISQLGNGDAIYSVSAGRNGVAGISGSPADNGVYGSNVAGGNGVMGSVPGAGHGVFGQNTGTGRAGLFVIDNTNNNVPALEAATNGTGDAIVGTSSSHNGVAGVSHSPGDNGVYGANDAGGAGVMGAALGAGGGSGVYGYSNGAGRAGYFVLENPSNSGPVLESISTGSNIGVLGRSNLAGVKGEATSGIGAGVFGVNNVGGVAVLGRNDAGNGTSILGLCAGSGSAGSFTVSNAGNSNAVVNVTHQGGGSGIDVYVADGGTGLDVSVGGNGRGALIQVLHDVSTRPALQAYTAGSGVAFDANCGATATNIALFKKAGTTKIRFDGNGKGYFNGGTQTGGADIAELFDVEGVRMNYEPGDVLVLSPNGGRRVAKCAEPYSVLLAGVFATQPGVLLTEKGIDDTIDQMVPMGVMGVIPTKVCTENGSIRIGDLLVTSSTPGCAMKADRSKALPGTVLGKAMEAFDGAGVAKIPVLVNVR